MTVGVYTILDASEDSGGMTGDEYKEGIDNNSKVCQRIAAAFAPHEQDTPNMTVRVDAGPLFTSGELTEIAAQNTSTITAPSVNPRIDRVVWDATTGAVSVVTGSEAAVPVAPDIPEGKLPCCQVALETTTTAITNDMITDERVGVGSGSGQIPVGGVYENTGTDPATELGYGSWTEKDIVESPILLLLHFEGSGATFVDSGPYGFTITANGAATQSTGQKKFGSKALDNTNDNVNDYIYTSDLIMPVDWWMDFWVYPDTSGNYFGCIKWHNENNSYIVLDGSLTLTICINGSFQTFGQANNAAWNHIRILFNGGVGYAAMNGTWSANKLTVSSANLIGLTDMRIGGDGSGIRSEGYIEEFLLCQGIRKPRANFSVPTAAWADPTTKWLRAA
jgi:hypothetical protein